MTERTKSWVKENFLQLIIVALIGAFFANYQAGQNEMKVFQEEMRAKFEDHEGRLTNLEYINILANKDLDQWQKEALLEYCRKRSGTIKK